MGKLDRKYLAHYIDSSLTAAPAYVMLGDDLEEYNIEMNANVNTIRNILGETKKSIDGYEPQASIEPYYASDGDPLFEKLQGIADGRKTLDELKTTVLEVHTWEEIEGQTGSYVAYKEDAIIEIVSYGGNNTGLQIPFNIHHIGNRIKGTFTASTKTFTPDAA
jgi:hypothetical protein